MKKIDICCIGHITHDKIITPRHTVHMPGGTSFYFAHAMNRLQEPSFLLVTAVGESDMKPVDELRAAGVDVRVLPSAKSVYFENRYGENHNERVQRVLAKADPFTIDGLRDVDAKYYHLGSLLADDFSLDVVKHLSEKGIVSVDAQGYQREVVGEEVRAVDWTDKMEALKYISILKVNENEAQVLTGISDPHASARMLANWGVKEVILTLGDLGSVIFTDGNEYIIPAYPPKEAVDATGCGDTYMAGYLFKRNQGCCPDESGRFAAAMCTIKLEASGPFDATKADVEKIIHHSNGK